VRLPPRMLVAVIAAVVFCGVGLAAPASAATTISGTPTTKRTLPKAKAKGTVAAPATVVENWTGPSALFHAASAVTRMTVVPAVGATDSQALKLQLNAHPEPGPSGAALIASNQLYRYGVFGSRMKTADCTGQDHPGVVTGMFTYSFDHADANRNGVSDNDEVDIEFLCGQPDVVYLTLWTDYSETSDNLREITRVINLRTGVVLSTCYLVSYSLGCRPLLAGENNPASVQPIPGFSSEAQFRSYSFDWQPDHVTFSTTDNAGRPLVLWDYRGPRSRIPAKPSSFMQNVTYTRGWDPLNGPSHNQPTVDTSAYVDSSFVPTVPAPAAPAAPVALVAAPPVATH
jgi:hypothetical protein